MDALILTFNKEQLKIYNELLEKDDVTLNFDTNLPEIEKFYIRDFDEVISNIEQEAITLLNLNKHSSSFAAFLKQDEIKEIIPIYYSAIRSIKRHATIIGGESWKLSYKIGEINTIRMEINKRYSSFLPYKAALYNRKEYAAEIIKIDNKFKASIEYSDELKKELLSLFETANKVCSIVSEFIKKSSKATDEPKFTKFDAYDFFWSVEAFLEQIKNIR